MNLHPGVVFLAGLVIVIVGAELLLRGASRIAALLGIRPIVIGLTVVSIGTSMPELAVGLTAAAQGKGSLAVGNIAGANLLNLLFILGLSALLRPLPIRLRSSRLDVPVMAAATLALWLLALNGVLSRTEGTVLLLAATAYTVAVVRLSRREGAALRREFAEAYRAPPAPPEGRVLQGAWNGVLLIGGIALTLFGADLLVSGAVSITTAYGVSDAWVGLTIVALGTASPELATTLVATYKNDRDVAVGNLIGSCIYNVLVILALTSVAAPGGLEVSREIIRIDLPFLAAMALVGLWVFRSGSMISRREGGCFVAAYLAYLGSLLFLRG